MTTPRATTSALAVRDVSVRFGSLTALADVSLELAPGERRALIGPNGAGKSTLFSVIAGMRQPSAGTVWLGDDDLTALPVDRRADRGVVTTFQHSSLFLRETALENVVLAARRRHPQGRSWLRAVARRGELLTHSAELLARVGLDGREAVLAGALSHGERRQLEVAIALASEPSVLLLDEPAAGMSAAETERFADLVRSLPREITLLLVEHDLDLVWDLAERVTVLHLGVHLLTGTPAQVRDSAEVASAYLGEGSVEDLFLDSEGAS